MFAHVVGRECGAAQIHATGKHAFSKAALERIGVALRECGFDPAAYVAMNDDLALLKMDERQALTHYLNYGIYENRCGPAGFLDGSIKSIAGLRLDDSEMRPYLLNNVIANQARRSVVAEQSWMADVPAVKDALGLANAAPYLVIGDSHSHAYAFAYARHLGQALLVPMLWLCSGGSAIGLGNERSKKRFGRQILNSLRPLSADRARVPIFFKFGQVDAEFVWIFKRIRERRQRASMEQFGEFAEESVARYGEFLEKVIALLGTTDSIRVCSIFPPSLSDESWAEGYVNAHIGFLEGDRELADLASAVRELEIPNLWMRTRMHQLYNACLQKKCAQLGILFVDDYSPMISMAGVVRGDLVKPDGGSNHHIVEELAAPIVGSVIERFCKIEASGVPPF